MGSGATGFSNNSAERTDSRSRHRKIVIDVRLPVGSRIGGSYMGVTVAIKVPRGPPSSETVGPRHRHTLRWQHGRSTARRSRGAGQDLAAALPSESCVRPRRIALCPGLADDGISYLTDLGSSYVRVPSPHLLHSILPINKLTTFDGDVL